MHNTSANRTGLPTLQLAAALTEQQWDELEAFANKRLRRSMNTPWRQRALAIYDGRTLVHTAIEQFALGDLGRRGGRILCLGNRVNANVFINAMRAAINSIISNVLGSVEFCREHIPTGLKEAERGVLEPYDTQNLGQEIELHDLQEKLFEELAQKTGDSRKHQRAMESLADDCQTGHVRCPAREGIDKDMKNDVRRKAQAIWKDLTID